MLELIVVILICVVLGIAGAIKMYFSIRAFTTKHPKLVRTVIFIMIAAIYLNIGWAYGTYSAMHLGSGMSQTTVLQKFLIGPDKILASEPNSVLLSFQILFMFVWPFWLGVTVLTWIMWLLVAVAAWMLWLVLWLFSGLWQIGVFVFRLFFAGGVAKLLGVG